MAITRRNHKGRKTANKKMRQRIGKKSKAMRKHRKSRRRLYGGSYTGDVADTNTFATYYIVKSATAEDNPELTPYLNQETPAASILEFGFNPVNIPQGSVLWVIDMQNDFLDLIDTALGKPGTLTGPPVGNGRIGAFAVTDGKSIVKQIVDFIYKYGSKFKKIIFTRDFHPQNHCSFGSSDPNAFNLISGHEGKFPQHCVYDTFGADITVELKSRIEFDNYTKRFKWVEGEGGGDGKNGKTFDNIEILFKGHHSGGDSYGAVPYSTVNENDTNYLNQRQNKNRDSRGPGDYADRTQITDACCTGVNCNNLTGGFKLKKEYYEKSISIEVIDPTITDKETMFKDMVEPYPLEETIPDEGAQVYVIGLAGEFCVKDTAINLKKYFTTYMPERNIKVNVIQDLTRYVFVPIFLSFQRYNMDGTLVPFGPWKNPADESRLSNAVFENKEYKPLSLYLFEYGGAYPTATKRLYLNESNQMIASNGTTIDENTDISVPTGLNYWHFAMNQNELIRDYAENGINLCISQSKDNIMRPLLQTIS